MGDTNIIEGPAFYCSDDVNTDVISPGRYEPYEGPEQLAQIALIDYEGQEPFVDESTSRTRFPVIVAGHEFGCGSSRETAPQALAYAGCKVVIARSFARIFFRNCINMGLLLPIQIDHGFGEEVFGEPVRVDTAARTAEIAGKRFEYRDFGPLEAILSAGGLLEYTKKRLEAST